MRMSLAQQELLDEIREKGGLYIKRYSRYSRTIEALRRKGLVRCDAPDHSSLGQDHFVPLLPEEAPHVPKGDR